MKASASQRGDSIVVQGQIALNKVVFATVDGARVAMLNLAVFGFDNGENPMGASTDRLELKLSEAEYAKYQKDGYPYSIAFPAIRGTQKIRFIVYDFGSDLIGRVDTPLF